MAQCISFRFFRLSAEWYRLPISERERTKGALLKLVQDSRRDSLLYTYDASLTHELDFLIWMIAPSPDRLRAFAAAIKQSRLGPYLHVPYSYFSITRRSQYVDKFARDHTHDRTKVVVEKRPFLFVYPFVKTHDWYMLPFEKRQQMMDEHIKIGHKYPKIKIHTSYAFGLDDPEFVLAFEGDSLEEFVQLVMDLRESSARPYTQSDTPIFTCCYEEAEALLDRLL